jgi:hypothetical protein
VPKEIDLRISFKRSTRRKLVRYRDENGQRWADVIDFLTMYPEALRKVMRSLGEIDAT